MSLRNRFVIPVILSALAVLAGCGGSSVTHPTPPPSGGFSASNLNGTYVFSTIGGDVNGFFVTITGTFTANGSSGITGGTIDINDSEFTSPVTNSPVAGGSYSVTADGRGQVTLTTLTPFGSSINFDFVLASSEHGLITQFDGNATGSGSLDLQTSSGQPAAGTYAFGLAGISGLDVNNGSIPAAAAGAVTLDASGDATGSFDYNDNAAPTFLTLASGSLLLAGGPGTFTLATSQGNLTFDVYVINPTHLKLIEIDTFPILSGDLFVQTDPTFPSGQVVFTMGGIDYLAGGFPMTLGGYMTSNGTTISNGVEDFDDGGTFDSTPQSFTGTATPVSGRYQLQVTSFMNGQNLVPGTFTFAAYPSSGGVQLVEIDGNGVTSGAAFAQSSTALSTSDGYGMSLSAANANGFEEDDIAEFTTTSTGFSGIMDINDQGQTSFGQSFSGTYSPDTPATGRGIITANLLSGVYYTVDNSTALFLETDASQLGVGILALQNASAKSNLTAEHLAVLRQVARSKAKKPWRTAH